MFEFAAPAYDDRQISFLLTNAQNNVFLKKYYTPNNRLQRGFEADEKRRRDLEQLIKQGVYPKASGSKEIEIKKSDNQAGVHPNGVFLDLPEGFLYAIEESANTTESKASEIIVKPITHDQYIANIKNPYKMPYKGLVWRMDYSRETDAIGENLASAKRTELITNPKLKVNSLTGYRVRYLRMPPAIVVDDEDPSNQRNCVLDESIHNEIIDEALRLAVAAVKPQEYQIAATERQINDN